MKKLLFVAFTVLVLAALLASWWDGPIQLAVGPNPIRDYGRIGG